MLRKEDPCVHMIQERLALMDTIKMPARDELSGYTHDFSKLPDKDFVHQCGLCHIKCSEYDLWQEMKRLYD